MEPDFLHSKASTPRFASKYLVPSTVPEHVERRVRRWLASGLGTSWVVAVSGGSDSVGLLRVLLAVAPTLGLTLSVAHLNHGARGCDSDLDAAFVADLAETFGIPFDLGHWKPTRPGHFESDARAARHAFLVATARARAASVVALGHTRDDQAETVLHRIVRGTGIHGLAGIPALRVHAAGITLVRPLLNVSRKAIREELRSLAQPFCEDASNADTSWTRARLRHDLLPRIAAGYNPKINQALVRLSRLAAGSARAVEQHLSETERAAALPGDAVFLRAPLSATPLFVRAEVIRRAWRRAGWPEAGMDANRWNRIARLLACEKPGRHDVGAGVIAVSDGRVFQLQKQPDFIDESSRHEIVTLSIPGEAIWQGERVVLTLDPDAPRDETIDLDRVSPPLLIRSPVAGDRFEPLGMEGKATPLNDFFRGRRIPLSARANTPLLCDRLGIIWVIGHRICDRVKVGPATERKAGLRFEVQRGGQT